MSTFKLNKLINKIGLLYKRRTVSVAKKHTRDNYLNHILGYNESRPYGYKELVCLAPSTALYFNLYGDVLACCKNTTSKLGNVKHKSIIDIWNGEERKQLIENIKSYSLENNGCIGCKNSIITGQYNSVLARMYDIPFMNIPKNIFPLDITFEISNTCNLECKMCNAEYSSSIRINRDNVPKLNNPYPDDFLEQLIPFLQHVKIVRFQGGEPFLINIYLDIIDKICEINPVCKIYIQTNGTVYNERVKKIISLKNLHLSISVDSLEKENYE